MVLTTTLLLTLCGFLVGESPDHRLSLRPDANDYGIQVESFPLKDRNLKIIRAENWVVFTAGMTIDADGAPNAYGPHNTGLDYTANARGGHGWVAVVTNQNGRPIVQRDGPYRGYYISTTSLRQTDIENVRDPRKYIDATKIPYIALPTEFAAKFNISLGDLAVVINQANGRSAYAIFADFGPCRKLGEGSMALAKQLGIPSDPRHDSVADGVTYLIFPRSAVHPNNHVTASKIRSATGPLYRRWGGTQRLRALGLAEPTTSKKSAAVEYREQN